MKKEDMREAARSARIRLGWSQLSYDLSNVEVSGFRITGITCRAPEDGEGEWFIVIKATMADGRKGVFFHTSYDLEEGLTEAFVRMHKQPEKWKEDKPYGDRK